MPDDESTPADQGAGRGARPPTARARRREQEIFDAAADIFDQKGYAASTLQDIGDAVGLLKGSLYYYIGSKQDLLYHITRTIHDGALANLAASAGAGPGADDRLRALIDGHIAAFETRSTWIRVFYTEYRHLAGARRAEIGSVRRRYEHYVEDLLRTGQAEGVFCPERDVRLMSNVILTTVNSVFLWYRPDRDGSLADYAGSYTDFVLAGLDCTDDHHHDRDHESGHTRIPDDRDPNCTTSNPPTEKET